MGIVRKIGRIIREFFRNVSVFDIRRKKMKEARKKLEKGETYVQKIDIQTFDGSGSITHPNVLYFKEGWNGYKFWMVFTPYDNDRVELEVPCMAVSNDGVNFRKVEGAPEPLIPALELREPMEYYSDPVLVFREGRLEVFYRYTKEEKKVMNRIYRITTEDGVNYSEPEVVLGEDGGFYMSLSLVREERGSGGARKKSKEKGVQGKFKEVSRKGELYNMYYFDDGGMFVRGSSDLKKWGKREKVKLRGFKGTEWHGEVREIDGEIILLLMSFTGELYFLKRVTRTEFSVVSKLELNYAPKGRFYSKVELYKSSIVKVGDIYYIYVPFKIWTMKGIRVWRRWEFTVTKVKKIGESGGT